MVRCGLAFCATDRGIRRERNHRFAPARRLIAGLASLLGAGAMSGCSVTTPIASLLGDEEVSTGSLKSAPQGFVERLSVEDWRRARAALAVALDPQGNGTPVRWDNPESKASGSFAASGTFFVRQHFVCRPFTATLTLAKTQSAPKGIACRQGPGDWVIDYDANFTVEEHAAPVKAATNARSAVKAKAVRAPAAGTLF